MGARKKVLRLGATAGTTALISAALAGGTAHAQDADHCIESLDTGEKECFSEFETAISAAEERTGNTIAEQKRMMKSKQSSRAMTTAAANDIILGTFFIHEQYGGATFTLYGDSLCSKDGQMEYVYNFSGDWVDSISSVQPWANCWIWLYPEPDLGGDRDGPYKENTPYVGDYMNDRTESVGFS
ncbi:hypothetical protein [Salinactinospora qingdaonensis]|uniref:Peptidase inhibitor family I36 n=1 Tax=Salinactinospora qingdaonensis TaxID=702744 RepID=A0ABP7EYN3_9ACTN